MKELNPFRQNLAFIIKVKNFRNQVLSWVTELCKEDGKKDFDAMAKLISDYEELDGKGLIGWAIGRVKTISPTISQADKKLSGVLDALSFKYKRIMNFVLEKNDFRSSDFFDEEAQQVYDLDEASACLGAAYNINYFH